jgi:hypothetical protein
MQLISPTRAISPTGLGSPRPPAASPSGQTVLSAPSARASRNTGRWAARVGLMLVLGFLPAAMGSFVLVGCGGDDDDAVDAGQDAGSLPLCKDSDCQAMAKPAMQVCSVGTPMFTCARNIDLRCAWLNPRCSGTSTGDALVDGPVDAGASDAASGDDAAVDAADASAND